ncbi:universal stress protein [Mycolicibacterium sp. XJ879]
MSDQQTSLGIVVGADGSPSSMAAVEWAARDAELRNVPLKVVHVVAPLVTTEGWTEASDDYARLQQDQARQIIEHAHKVAVEAASSDRAAQVSTEVSYAPVVPTLLELSKRTDMIVVGCRGQGAVSRALMGSVSSGVAHHAYCPVAVVHDEVPLTERSQAPVVVGIDGSPTSELATQIAFDAASRRGVELVALHAWSDMGPLGFPPMDWAPIEWRNIKDHEEEVLAERLAGWQERYPDVGVRRVVVCDRPAPRLLEQADNAQLVVLGSHGRGGFTGMLLGSVSTAVANAAQVPVIIARMPRG